MPKLKVIATPSAGGVQTPEARLSLAQAVDGVHIRVDFTTATGLSKPGYYLATITDEGRLVLAAGLPPDCGLDLDRNQAIRLDT